MTKGIVLERPGVITYREFKPEEYYKPTAEGQAILDGYEPGHFNVVIPFSYSGAQVVRLSACAHV